MTASWGRATLPIVVALGALVLRAPYFVEPPGRDQSLHMVEAQALLAGGGLYTDVWDHRAPGIKLAYALAMVGGGQDYLAICLLDAVAIAATAALLAVFVRRRLAASLPALVAAGLYAVTAGSVAFGAFWGRAQAEVLLDPFLAVTLIYLFGGGARSATKPRHGFLAGLCLAAAIGLKYSALPLLLLIAPPLLRRDASPGSRARLLAAYAAGVLLPAVAVLAWFWTTGRLGLFLDATVAFNLAHGHVAALPRGEDLLPKVLYQPALLLPLYLLGAWALVGGLFERARSGRLGSAAWRLFLLGLFVWVLELGAVFLQGKFWIYHYQVVLLPLCLVAAAGAGQLVDLLVRRGTSVRMAHGLTLLLIAVASLPLVRERFAYAADHEIAPVLRGELERERLLATYRWGDTDYDALETRLVGRRLGAEMAPDERLFVWGFEAGLYVHSGRRPASRFLFDYPLMPAFGRFHERYVALLMEDLQRHPPARIVIVSGDANAIEPKDSVEQLLDVPELHRLVLAEYEPAWQQGDFWVLRRVR